MEAWSRISVAGFMDLASDDHRVIALDRPGEPAINIKIGLVQTTEVTCRTCKTVQRLRRAFCHRVQRWPECCCCCHFTGMFKRLRKVTMPDDTEITWHKEQIAKNRAILKELEARNTAGGDVFPETDTEIEHVKAQIAQSELIVAAAEKAITTES
jgi:hypothetical protein